MKKYKIAIEPIISTILLVVVSVILVVIFLSWGKDFSGKSLNKVDEVIDESCKGAMINVTHCVIIDDNITFRVQNIGTYSFSQTDNFKMFAIDNYNNSFGETDISYLNEWNGLEPGELNIANVLVVNDLNTSQSNISVTLTVRSEECPLVSKTIKNCHK